MANVTLNAVYDALIGAGIGPVLLEPKGERALTYDIDWPMPQTDLDEKKIRQHSEMIAKYGMPVPRKAVH